MVLRLAKLIGAYDRYTPIEISHPKLAGGSRWLSFAKASEGNLRAPPATA